MSSSFDAGYDKAFGDVFDFAVRAVRDPHRAADVVLETMRRVRRDLAGRRLPKGFTEYSRGVAAAIVVDELAQLLHVAPFAACMGEQVSRFSWANLAGAPHREEAGPPQTNQTKEEQAAEATWAALEELPPKDYALLHLNMRSESAPEDIAGALRRDESDIKNEIRTAKRTLDRSVRLRLIEKRSAATCDGLRGVLAALPAGITSSDRLDAVEAHAEGCETCADQWKNASGAISVFRNLAMMPSSACVKAEILDRINGEFVGFVHETPTNANITAGVSVRKRVATAIAVFIAIILLGGGTAAIISAGNNDPRTKKSPLAGAPTPTPSPTVLGTEFTPSPTPSPTPTTSPTPSPTPTPSATVTVPGAPRVDFTLTTQRYVSLRWTRPAANGAAIVRYEVHRALGSGSFARITYATGTSYEDRKASPGNTYRYRVAAVNAEGRGPFSRIISVTIPVRLPSQPTNIQLDAGGCDNYIGWSPPTTEGDSPVTGYVVSRILNGGPEEVIATLPATAVNYTDGLGPLGNYTVVYRIAARNSQGTGPAASTSQISGFCSATPAVA